MSGAATPTAVARNLREIGNLAQRLEARAMAKAADPLMPGGLAMVALVAVSNLEAWQYKLDSAEQYAEAKAWRLGTKIDLPEIEDDDEWEPPLQTLCFWSEQWRVETGTPLVWVDEDGNEHDRRPTIASEATFLRWALNWAWDNEPHWADFARDIADARFRLEDLLLAGARPVARGVPCLYDECKGARLIRQVVPSRDKDDNKVWRLTDWHCPRCKRSWDEDAYKRNIYAAVARAKVEVLEELDGPEVWCTVDHAARRVHRPEATLRTWIHRGEVAVACIVTGRRERFVRLADVEARDRLARERAARRQAAIDAKQGGRV